MSGSNQTQLWRNTPPEGFTTQAGRLASEFVFPSGRKALAFAVHRAGLTRADRIALPEWSSHCVISAVGWNATPVPMREVLEFGIPVEAVLIYEQWGWPLCQSAYPELQERFGDAAIIWDRVDSAQCWSPICYKLPSPPLEIISLSKLLGLEGGGLCQQGGEILRVPRLAVSPITSACLHSDTEILATLECKEFFKNQSEVPHPGVLEWIAANDFAAALEQEKQLRIEHLRVIRDHPLASGWPEWMQESVDAGAAPGIVPLLRGAPPAMLREAAATLAFACATESAFYQFNWSGNPLSPSYEPCLAVPVHGQMNCIPELLENLERVGAAWTALL